MHGLTDEPLKNSDTALHLACLYGNLPCVEVTIVPCFVISTEPWWCICTLLIEYYLLQLLLERGADMEVKDLYRATPLHNACDGGKVVHGPLYFFLMVTFYCSLFFFFWTWGRIGYLDIVEFLLSRASCPECAKRMIETIDLQGDTVSILPSSNDSNFSPSLLTMD